MEALEKVEVTAVAMIDISAAFNVADNSILIIDSVAGDPWYSRV